MDNSAGDGAEVAGRTSGLADLSLLCLADLFKSDDSAVAAAIRYVVRDVELSAQAISGWSSYVDDETASRRSGDTAAS